MEETSLVQIDVGKSIKRPDQAKLTPAKRRKFLEVYANTGNMSKAAAAVNVSRNAIYWLKKHDDKFKKAYDYIEDIITDQLEEVSLNLASLPSREGFQDRKLQLMARRPEKYGSKTEVNVNNNVSFNMSVPEVRRILSNQGKENENSANIEEAEYTEVE